MARIGRRVFVTHCEGFGFDSDNNRFEVNEDLNRRCTDLNRATKLIQKKYKNNRIVIKTIEIKSKYYSMPVEVFLENCDQITDYEKNVKEIQNV